MARRYENRKLLEHLAQVKADMIARGEWRDIPSPNAPPVGPPVQELADGCDSCRRDIALTDVKRRDRPTVRLCETCLDKWQYSHVWRNEFLDRFDAAARRRSRS